MMLNSHIAQQHNAALQRESLVVAARARMLADADRPRRLRVLIARPFPRSRVVAAATHVSQISGSGNFVDGPPGNRPPGA